MSEKSLFWNALPDSAYPTGYDRNYNADDISDWLATVLTTGVIKSTTALKVSATSGMVVSVAAGKAVINGKPYTNDSAKTFTVPTAPTGSTNRVDLIVLRFDKRDNVRATNLVYVTGTNASVPAIKRDATYYDLVVASIIVTPNATAINQGMITDLRGDAETEVTTETGKSLGFCPWLVAAKGYENYYDAIVLEYEDTITLSAASASVVFNIPQYGWTGVDILTVYTNGLRESPDNYTITNNTTITFDAAKTAGAKIQVVVDKFIDGEGLGTALEQYKALQTIVLNLQKVDAYNYICNGVNDNVMLSQIAQAWLDSAESNNDLFGSKKINVFGTFGCTAPAAGSGTASDRYKWFNFGRSTSTGAKIIFDFSACSTITLPITAAAYNDVFYGSDMSIIGANVVCYQTGTGTRVRVFSSEKGAVYAENCRFWVTSYQDSIIASNGTFVNCRASVANTYAANSYCFLPSNDGILTINGGIYLAYTGGASAQSAIVGQSSANAVSILYGVSAPTVARSGFYQTNALIQYAGGGMMNCTDLVSALPLIVTAGISNIRGTIAKSKPQ